MEVGGQLHVQSALPLRELAPSTNSTEGGIEPRVGLNVFETRKSAALVIWNTLPKGPALSLFTVQISVYQSNKKSVINSTHHAQEGKRHADKREGKTILWDEDDRNVAGQKIRSGSRQRDQKSPLLNDIGFSGYMSATK
jgi:hypothetical protein